MKAHFATVLLLLSLFCFLLSLPWASANLTDAAMRIEPMVVNDWHAGYCIDEEERWKSMGSCVHFVNMPCLPAPDGGCSYELCCQTPHH